MRTYKFFGGCAHGEELSCHNTQYIRMPRPTTGYDEYTKLVILDADFNEEAIYVEVVALSSAILDNEIATSNQILKYIEDNINADD